MNAKRIDYILTKDQNTKYIWRGFLAPDVTLEPIPGLYIVNTAPSNEEGEHWCCLFVKRNYECEFFDSFGNPPNIYNLVNSFVPGCKHITYTTKMVQSIEAKTCGHHCIFYAISRAKNMNVSAILKLYSDVHLKQNDDMVYNYVLKHFGYVLAEIQD